MAKVVLAARGETATNEDFPKLLTRAQAALDRQPGRGLASDEAVRATAQSALKAINQLPELRNRVGTGHGRALAPVVAEEVALITVDLAMMWCRWALRRLPHVIHGRPANVITHLETGTFYRGDLASRLEATRLDQLLEPDQAALGIAVAHRAMRDTFLVMEEGVAQCAQSGDTTRWPSAYRRGLITGLLINAEGQLETSPWAVQQIGLLLAVVDDPVAVLTELAARCQHAWLGPKLGTPQARNDVWSAMYAEDPRLPPAAVQQWTRIRERIVPPPF